ncbi:MAG: RNA methyltransferase [Thermosipho sp. (in: Bacteria)]|nr:RNA methyltransferase [Thermosipho sp. (in: thermotogales)]
MKLVLTCTAGFEAATSLEVKNFGYKILDSTSGRIFINGEVKDIPFLNLWLRTAERVYIVLKEEKVENFEELFEAIYSIDWFEYIFDGNIFISDVSVRNSKLTAKGAIISVATAAIMKKLGKKTSGKVIYPVRLILKNNILMVLLDTTGKKALSKRGYRLKTSKAPLRETIAAAMILLSRWNGVVPLYDPFCGSGTIPIEAAMILYNIPPGINRDFVSEKWKIMHKYWLYERKKLQKMLKPLDFQQQIIGFDIDSNILNVAKENLKKLNLHDMVEFQNRDFNKLGRIDERCYIVTNPPYGERLKTNIDYSSIWNKFPNSNVYILSPDSNFEKKIGRRAKKKIRFQNSGIWVWFYMFY